jgi:hypothetical protein
MFIHYYLTKKCFEKFEKINLMKSWYKELSLKFWYLYDFFSLSAKFSKWIDFFSINFTYKLSEFARFSIFFQHFYFNFAHIFLKKNQQNEIQLFKSFQYLIVLFWNTTLVYVVELLSVKVSHFECKVRVGRSLLIFDCTSYKNHSILHGSRSTDIISSKNFTSYQNIFTAYFTFIKEARRDE